MRLHCLPLALLLAGGSAALAQAPAPAPVAADKPTTALPYTPSLDVKAMDQTADPCQDFYRYACGGWVQANPVPADQSRWSVYGKMAQDNQRYLWGILQGLATQKKGRSAAQQKTGDYFGACMDVAAIEKLGAKPLAAPLALISGMHSKADLPVVLGKLQLTLASSGLFFGFGANQDYGDSTQVIAFATAGGLGLPDRDYYLKTDDKSVAIRAAYLAYIGATFERLGEPAALARDHAAEVMALETALAGATLTRVERRDPKKRYNKFDAAGLQALTPGFEWPQFLRTLGVDSASFNVTEPAFFKALAQQWAEKDLATLQTYLRWQVARNMAPSLSSNFDMAHFDFYSRTLRGVKEPQPRWKRCVALVDNQLGEALGQEFVRRNFSGALREKALHMTVQVEQAMKADIDALDWMSAETKARAQEKLAGVANKIGFPDKWRDYGSFVVRAEDFAGNIERGNRFEQRRMLAKIGKPVDHKEWSMTPPTVNAYYNAQMNDINFPAGILQPPLYDPKMDDAPNYGNTGGSIGHELVHAFDDSGRQFDAAGNLKDWWTKDDADKFGTRAQCIVDQYSGYTIIDDIKINGKLTQGEDIADLGGLILAYVAWKAEMANMPQQAQPLRETFTPEQRFFIGYAQWACENVRPEEQRVRALTDPHSPGRYRVIGPLVNMPEFEKAFACKAGQAMVSEKRCRVW